MGQIVLPSAGPIYIDANSVIYFVEQIEPYLTASRPLWDALNAGRLQVHTSELTRLEVLVRPLRDGNSRLTALFQSILSTALGLQAAPITRTILEKAAHIRATFNLKTPDAIHAATALETQCVMFVTNDTGFRRVSGLNVVVLADVVAS